MPLAICASSANPEGRTDGVQMIRRLTNPDFQNDKVPSLGAEMRMGSPQALTATAGSNRPARIAK